MEKQLFPFLPGVLAALLYVMPAIVTLIHAHVKAFNWALIQVFVCHQITFLWII